MSAQGRTVRFNAVELLGFQATVVAAEGGRFSLDVSGVCAAARRALSCLVEPVVGDVVMAALPGSDVEGWVLAVLDRPRPSRVDLVVDGDVSVRARDGRLTLAAPAAIDLVTGGAITAAGRAVELSARDTTLTAERAVVVAGSLSASVDALTLDGDSATARVGRVALSAESASRTVTGMDTVRAGESDQRTEGMLRVHAGHAVVSADALVKMDADQVHIG